MELESREEILFSVRSFFNAYLLWLRGIPAGLVPVGLVIAAVEVGSPGTLMEIARSKHLQALLPLYVLLLGALFLLPGYRLGVLKKRYIMSKADFYRDHVTVFTGIPGQNKFELPGSLIRRIEIKRGPGQRMAGLCTLVLRGKALIVRVPDIPYSPLLPGLTEDWVRGADAHP